MIIGIGMWVLSVTSVFAQSGGGSDGEDVKLEIMPKAEGDLWAVNQQIINNGDHVRDTYNSIAQNTNTPDQVDEQLASGVMTRDTIINYGVLLLRFLSQAGLAIGWLMFIYVGYQYIMGVFTGESPDSSLINKAIWGIIIVIFAYAFMKALITAFLT